MRLLTTSVMALLLATPLSAQDRPPLGQPIERPDRPVGQPLGQPVVGVPAEPGEYEREQEHVVRRGDTLWDLAGHYLANPFRWPLIAEANRQIVRDPHWIYPDQVLVIPGLRERVAVRGDAARTFEPAAPPARTVFYREPLVRRGDQPTVLMEPLSESVPVKPGEFYRAQYLAQPQALPVVARVVRSLRELEQSRLLLPSAHPHDDLYVTYVRPGAVEVGDRFVVAEVGRRIPAAGRDVRVIDPRAIVRVVELDEGVMRVNIEEQFDRVIRGHVVLPLEFYPDFLSPVAEPVEGEFDLVGRIVSFAEDSPLPGLMTRAFIDLGAASGVQVGDMFEAYVEERPTRDARTAPVATEAVAVLRVIRVEPGTATVVVDEVMQPKLADGIPVRRVRKMP